MLSLIPEPKQVRITDKKPWQAGGEVRLQLAMEVEDPGWCFIAGGLFPAGKSPRPTPEQARDTRC